MHALLALHVDTTRTTWEVPQEQGALEALVRDNRLCDASGNDVQRPLDLDRLASCLTFVRSMGNSLLQKLPVLMDVEGVGTCVLDMQHGLTARGRIMDSRDTADIQLAATFPSVITATWLKSTTPVSAVVRFSVQLRVRALLPRLSAGAARRLHLT